MPKYRVLTINEVPRTSVKTVVEEEYSSTVQSCTTVTNSFCFQQHQNRTKCLILWSFRVKQCLNILSGARKKGSVFISRNSATLLHRWCIELQLSPTQVSGGWAGIPDIPDIVDGQEWVFTYHLSNLTCKEGVSLKGDISSEATPFKMWPPEYLANQQFQVQLLASQQNDCIQTRMV